MTNVKQINTVSYMTHSVCFSHCSNHETTKINLSEIDDTVCQIKSIFNDQEDTKSIQLLRQHIGYTFH